MSQGKGLTREAARASALMESVESWHAEHFEPLLRLGSAAELGRTLALADLGGLPWVPGGPPPEQRSLLWVEGTDLLRGRSVWLPFEVVALNAVEPSPLPAPSFRWSSNGLAGGNHALEAISHGLCEVVERDAVRLWELRGPQDRGQTRVDLASVDDAACAQVLADFQRAGLAVGVWEATSDIPMPCFVCVITERERDPMHPLYAAGGFGCHPDRGVALLRALTEAAQSRLTAISGARDDVSRALYGRGTEAERWGRIQRAIVDAGPGRDFRTGAGWWAESIAEDVRRELACLRAVGLSECIVVDLTRQDVGVPVVRVVVPGLEGWFPEGGRRSVLGERGRRACLAMK